MIALTPFAPFLRGALIVGAVAIILCGLIYLSIIVGAYVAQGRREDK